eukprot:2085409-Lingulodinium_polyedra.AAC.1
MKAARFFEKRYKVGSLEWHEARAELRPGPTSVPDLFNWPTRCVDEMRAELPACMPRLAGHISAGVVLHTQYSGKGTAESAFAKVGEALAQVGLLRSGDSRWAVGTACDKKAVAQRVLLAHDDASGPCHVYQDMNDLVSDGMRQMLDAMSPSPAASDQVKHEACRAQLNVSTETVRLRYVCFRDSHLDAWCS